MEVINRRILADRPGDEIKIVGMGCIHYGAAGCDEELADFWLKKVATEPNTYLILGGDLVDAITEKDKRYMEEEAARWCFEKKWGGTLADRQWNYAYKKFKPLAEKGKILWLHTGNHEQGLKRYASRDMSLDWARSLRVPYAGLAALSNLVIETTRRHTKRIGPAKRAGYYANSVRIRFFTQHGGGGAQTAGAIINRVSQMLDRYDVQVALMWHLHRKMHISRRQLTITAARGGEAGVKPLDRIAAICGTFLDGHVEGVASYGELKGYEPIIPGPVVIHIRPDCWDQRSPLRRGSYSRIWVSDAIRAATE